MQQPEPTWMDGDPLRDAALAMEEAADEVNEAWVAEYGETCARCYEQGLRASETCPACGSEDRG
jgi:hypothetical protein